MKSEVEYGFGPHLMLDCYGCAREKLEDLAFISRVLDEFPEKIGMTRLMSPYVFKYHGKQLDEWGVSGVVLIAESHISIHTFPDKEYAFIDVFSSRNFDVDFARDEFVKAFSAGRFEVMLLNRGAEFPKNIYRAANLVARERESLAHACK